MVVGNVEAGPLGAFDAFTLCDRGRRLVGTVDARSLPRLADRLAEPVAGAGAIEWQIAGAIEWQIAGATDDCGRPALAVALAGGVPLVCQRCLATFVWPVAHETLLLLARNEAELAQLDEDDGHEVLLAEEALDARELIEEELLLTLPFVPRCADPQCCAGDARRDAGAQEAPSPFAALADMQLARAKRRGS
jgi:uncharacterized protein